MDFGLAALKLVCAQLREAKETQSQNSFTLGGILFQRAWLQGVLVSTSDAGAPLLLDDGTGVIHLSLSGDFRLRPWKTGMYVMVVGGYIASSGEPPMIKHSRIERQCGILKLLRHTNCSMVPIEEFVCFCSDHIVER